MRRPGFWRAGAALFLAAVTACAATAQVPTKPKLVVLLVIDGLPQRQVLAYRDQLAPDGLARFLERGAWFADAHYGHALTVTAPGHATMLTGAYPHRTGIIANEWRDLSTGAEVYCVGDPVHGASPRNLRAETVGDVLRRLDARSKVIGISGKDRGAILPAGKSGTAYMYMSGTGQFASTTYYMKQHPAWVDAFNARKPADRYFKALWKPLLPEEAYARSVQDNQPWFGPRGGKLPMVVGAAADDAPGPRFYGSLLASPFADMLALEFAQAAIAGEQLGRDNAPDILSVSLSGHDYVNHQWSAESRLSHDHLLHVDRAIQAFFQHLDAAVGKDSYIAVLTADHGFMPAPEYSHSQGLAGGRLSGVPALARMNAELERGFGVPRLVAFSSASAVVLDRRKIAQRGLDFDAVTEAARAMLLTEPAIAAAYTRRELETGSRGGSPFFDAIRKSWHKDLSGDVQYVFKPGWMPGSAVATHGSPHPYDTHVPILFYGPKWVRAGRFDGRVEVADIAPTLAQLLGVPAPSASEGRVLPLLAHRRP
jgi:arylsulfatase A-like enzyme